MKEGKEVWNGGLEEGVKLVWWLFVGNGSWVGVLDLEYLMKMPRATLAAKALSLHWH